MRQRPDNAVWFAWRDFEEWANENEISDEHEEDWFPWWLCWKAGYAASMREPQERA